MNEDEWQIDKLTFFLQDTDVYHSIIDEIIAKLSFEEDEDVVKKVLRCVASNCIPDSQILKKWTQLLESFRYPQALICTLADICGSGDDEVLCVFQAFHNIVSNDRQCLLPVLGALAEMELSPVLRLKTFKMAESALEFADEDDLPTIVRSLLRTMTHSSSDKVVHDIRKHCSSFKDHIILIILEIIHDVLRVNSHAASSFFYSLRYSSFLSLFDVLLLIIILEIDKNAHKAILFVANNGVLTLSSLKKSISYLDVRWAGAVLQLCALFLHSKKKDLQQWSLELILLAFQKYDTYRSDFFRFLLSNATSVFRSDIENKFASLALCMLPGDTLSPYVQFLEQTLEHPASLSPLLLSRIIYTFVSAVCHKPEILDSLFIMTQKYLFSREYNLCFCGITLAGQVLSRVPNYIKHVDLFRFSLQLLQECNINDSILSCVFDVLSYSVKYIESGDVATLLNAIIRISESRLPILNNKDSKSDDVLLIYDFNSNILPSNHNVICFCSFLRRLGGGIPITSSVVDEEMTSRVRSIQVIPSWFVCYFSCLATSNQQNALKNTLLCILQFPSQIMQLYEISCSNEFPHFEKSKLPHARILESGWCAFFTLSIFIGILNRTHIDFSSFPLFLIDRLLFIIKMHSILNVCKTFYLDVASKKRKKSVSSLLETSFPLLEFSSRFIPRVVPSVVFSALHKLPETCSDIDYFNILSLLFDESVDNPPFVSMSNICEQPSPACHFLLNNIHILSWIIKEVSSFSFRIAINSQLPLRIVSHYYDLLNRVFHMALEDSSLPSIILKLDDQCNGSLDSAMKSLFHKFYNQLDLVPDLGASLLIIQILTCFIDRTEAANMVALQCFELFKSVKTYSFSESLDCLLPFPKTCTRFTRSFFSFNFPLSWQRYTKSGLTPASVFNMLRRELFSVSLNPDFMYLFLYLLALVPAENVPNYLTSLFFAYEESIKQNLDVHHTFRAITKSTFPFWFKMLFFASIMCVSRAEIVQKGGSFQEFEQSVCLCSRLIRSFIDADRKCSIFRKDCLIILVKGSKFLLFIILYKLNHILCQKPSDDFATESRLFVLSRQVLALVQNLVSFAENIKNLNIPQDFSRMIYFRELLNEFVSEEIARHHQCSDPISDIRLKTFDVLVTGEVIDPSISEDSSCTEEEF